MEKQPVDDLFARKLREAEVNVSPDAFARLQRRMGVKEMPRKKENPFWRYAAAACLLGALAVGYVVNTNQKPAVGEQSRVSRHAGKQRKSPEHIDEARPVTGGEASPQKLATIGVEKTTESQYGHSKRAKQSPKAGNVKGLVSPMTGEPDKRAVEAVAVEPLARKESLSVGPQLATISQPIQMASAQKAVTGRTIILTIDEPQLLTDRVDRGKPAFTEEARPHGFSGLLGKLRQLKNGETFARATPGAAQAPATPLLGRTITELKESLKNETTLDQ